MFTEKDNINLFMRHEKLVSCPDNRCGLGTRLMKNHNQIGRFPDCFSPWWQYNVLAAQD